MSDIHVTVTDNPTFITIQDTPIVITIAEQGTQGIGSTGPSGAIGPVGPAGSGSSNLTNVVFTTGDQTIVGRKTFPENIEAFTISGVGGNNFIVDLQNGVLQNYGVDSVHWQDRVLTDNGGNQSILWGNGLKLLTNDLGDTTVKWGLYQLIDGATGSISLDWYNRILYGDWTKNGNFILTNIDSGNLQNQINNKYLSSNPSGYITGFNSGLYLLVSQTGQFYPSSNPQQYATSGNLSSYYTNNNLSGFITAGQTGQFYPLSNPSNFSTSGNVANTGAAIISLLSNYYLNSNPQQYITSGNVSSFYYTKNNESGFLNTLSGLSTGYIQNISGVLDLRLQSTGGNLWGQINSIINGTGNFYLSSNPQNYIKSGDVSSAYATINNLASTGQQSWNAANNNAINLSGNLQTTGINLNNKINNLSGYINSSNSNIVFTTGDQTINESKTFSDKIITDTISGLSSSKIVDVNEGALFAEDGQSVHWNDRVLKDSNGENSIKWGERMLCQDNGDDALTWNYHELRYNGDSRLNWDSNLLTSSNGNDSISWEDRLLRDDNASESILWDSRMMKDTAAANSLDWTNRYLYGNWVMDNNLILTTIDSGNLQSQVNLERNKPTVTGISISGGNSITGIFNFTAGSNITLTQNGNNTLSIASAAGGGGSSITNAVTGNGTVNYLSKFTSNNSGLINSNIIDSGNNITFGITNPGAVYSGVMFISSRGLIGIGNNNPIVSLDVSGDIKGDNLIGTTLQATGSNNLTVGGGATNGDIILRRGGTNTNWLTIKTDGSAQLNGSMIGASSQFQLDGAGSYYGNRTSMIGWGRGASFANVDTTISRNGSGIVEINTGISGGYGGLIARTIRADLVSGLSNNSYIDFNTYSIYDSVANLSINFNNRAIYDGNGLTAIYWQGRQLFDAAVIMSLNWNDRNLFRSDLSESLRWESSELLDINSTPSLNWDSRSANNSSAVEVLNWESLELNPGWTKGGNFILTSIDSGNLQTQINQMAIISNPITGNGTLNYLPKFTTNNSGVTNSIIYDSGLVGINTNSPLSHLDISGCFAIRPVQSSGSLITLGNNSFYINTGNALSTWKLPLAAASPGRFYFLKNKAGAITLTGNSSTESLFTSQKVLTLTINSGESYIVASNSLSEWQIM